MIYRGLNRTYKWYQSEFTLIGLMSWVRSLIPAIINNFKCLSAFGCEDLNKKDNIASVDLIDARETLSRELTNLWKLPRNSRKG